MISDDLSGLFGAGPAGPTPDSSLRQGRLLTFDPSTGSNTVLVGTTILTNVPMLQTGAEVGLTQGSTVLLAQIGYTFLVMGRITSPSGANFASASQSQVAINNSARNFAVSTSFTTLCTVTITIPVWANTVSVLSSWCYNARNNFGADTDMEAKLISDGEASYPVGTTPMDVYAHNGSWSGVSIGHAIKHTVTPGSTISILGQGQANGGFTADPSNSAFLSCLATFSKQ